MIFYCIKRIVISLFLYFCMTLEEFILKSLRKRVAFSQTEARREENVDLVRSLRRKDPFAGVFVPPESGGCSGGGYQQEVGAICKG